MEIAQHYCVVFFIEHGEIQGGGCEFDETENFFCPRGPHGLGFCGLVATGCGGGV